MHLHVVTPLFNPGGYEAVPRNMRRFLRHMGDCGLRVTLVEAAFGTATHTDVSFGMDHVDHVKVRGRSAIWLKENLGNIGISRAPEDAEGILWLDGDIEFLREDWVKAVEHGLNQYAVIQPWGDVIQTGPNGESVGLHKSFASQYVEGKPWPGNPPRYGDLWHPGYAWAFRRTALEVLGGLIETAIIGSADHHMACALLGRAEESCVNSSDEYKKPVLDWQERAQRLIRRDLGYIKGTIRHHWHGRSSDRKYMSRRAILLDSSFNPAVHLRKNLHGVLELTDDSIALRDGVRAYFRGRNDDANTV